MDKKPRPTGRDSSKRAKESERIVEKITSKITETINTETPNPTVDPSMWDVIKDGISSMSAATKNWSSRM